MDLVLPKNIDTKKILFIGNTSWSMWNFRREIMLYLKSKGASVAVLAPEDKFSTHLAENFNFRALKHLNRKSKNPLHDLFLLAEVYSKIRKMKPDLVFLYTIKPNIYGNFAARLQNIKTISIVPGTGYAFSKKGLVQTIARTLYKATIGYAEKIIFLNTRDLRDFEKARIVTECSESSVLFPGEGVDTEHYKMPRIKRFLPEGKGKFYFIGRLLKDKGIMEFIEAAQDVKKDFPNTHFHVVGPIDRGNPMCIDSKTLERHHDEGTIIYHGTKDDVREDLSTADALVLPTRYKEGLSRICLEALSLGIPVISTKNRGCLPIVIHEKTGILLEGDDACSVKNGLISFLKLSASKRECLGLEGRHLVVKNFSIDVIIRKYLKMISDSIETAEYRK